MGYLYPVTSNTNFIVKALVQYITDTWCKLDKKHVDTYCKVKQKGDSKQPILKAS